MEKISDQSKKRALNRYTILRTIQMQGPMRRTGFSKFCGIRKSSVASITEDLVNEGLLRLSDQKHPRSPLEFDNSRWYVAAVGITSTEIIVGRVDLHGQWQFGTAVAIEPQSSIDEVMMAVLRCIRQITTSVEDDLLGIGVSVPGIVDSKKGICHRVITMANFFDVQLGDRLREKFSCPVIVENDVRASLWASIWFDQLLIKYKSALYLDIANGVGSALLVDGRPHTGENFAAGEIGHLPAGDEGRICGCGKTDCLESYCSLSAMIADIKTLAPDLTPLRTAEDVALLAKSHAVVHNVLDRAMGRLSAVVAVQVACVDPDVIILGNQNSKFYQVVQPMLERHLHERLHGLRGVDNNQLEIIIAKDSAYAGPRGAAGLIIDSKFQSGF